jgi:hypothetical protein
VPGVALEAGDDAARHGLVEHAMGVGHGDGVEGHSVLKAAKVERTAVDPPRLAWVQEPAFWRLGSLRSTLLRRDCLTQVAPFWTARYTEARPDAHEHGDGARPFIVSPSSAGTRARSFAYTPRGAACTVVGLRALGSGPRGFSLFEFSLQGGLVSVAHAPARPRPASCGARGGGDPAGHSWHGRDR